MKKKVMMEQMLVMLVKKLCYCVVKRKHARLCRHAITNLLEKNYQDMTSRLKAMLEEDMNRWSNIRCKCSYLGSTVPGSEVKG